MLDADRLSEAAARIDFLQHVFECSKKLGLVNYYVGAGCIAQSIWNDLTGRPHTFGINDMDIVYYDASDLSHESENEVEQRAYECFSDLPIRLDVKNQARVHLWYANKFGIKINPYKSLEEAIDTWPTTATALGARIDEVGNIQAYAPFGLSDLFSLTIRPNKRIISEEIFYEKANKWRAKWPELQVVEW